MDTVFHFTWDHAKNHANRRKHKVSFEEAESVFFDDSAVSMTRIILIPKSGSY